MSEVLNAVHKLVLNGNMPARTIAVAVGKPYQTFMREINPEDLGAKLGVGTFMAIGEATGNPAPLNMMVQELGYRLAPVD